MLKIALLGIIFLLLSVTLAYAENATCLPDNITLIHDYGNVVVNGQSVAVTYTEPCTNGCDSMNNLCNPPSWQQDVAIIGVIAIFLIIMAVFLRRRH